MKLLWNTIEVFFFALLQMSIESYTCSVLRRVADCQARHLSLAYSGIPVGLCDEPLLDGAVDTKAERLPLGVELPPLLKKEP